MESPSTAIEQRAHKEGVLFAFPIGTPQDEVRSFSRKLRKLPEVKRTEMRTTYDKLPGLLVRPQPGVTPQRLGTAIRHLLEAERKLQVVLVRRTAKVKDGTVIGAGVVFAEPPDDILAIITAVVDYCNKHIGVAQVNDDDVYRNRFIVTVTVRHTPTAKRSLVREALEAAGLVIVRDELHESMQHQALASLLANTTCP